MEKSPVANIKVYARVRPPLQREIFMSSYVSCLAVKGNDIYATKDQTPIVIDSNAGLSESQTLQKVAFDGVFDENSNQEQVYRAVAAEMVQGWLSGINCTLFAYGVTGTGKTHTMEGKENDPGILPRTVQDLYAHIEEISDHDYIVEFSAVQIYCEKIYDLLNERNVLNLIAIKGDIFYQEPFQMTKVEDSTHLLTLYKQAQKLKVTSATKMNSESTRGHVIYTIQVTALHRDSGKVTKSKFNIVDLAGSERISKSGVTGDNLKEAIKINLSLTTLVRVVESLVDVKSLSHKTPPFRDSLLTLALRDSLGGKFLTNMIVALSPAMSQAGETLRSLQFGAMCRFVKNSPTENIVENKYFNRNQYRSEKPKEEKPIPKAVPWKDYRPQVAEYLLETKLGKISIFDNGETPERTKLILLMHACPSDKSELLHFFPCLTFYGFRVVAIDQPGYGNSRGKAHPSRSENNLDKGGPADVALAVVDALGFDSFIAGGYDWGAGIALSLAQKYQRRVKAVIALLPSFNVAQDSEVKAILAKVLVLWIKHDQMHNWNRWKAIANKLPNKSIHVIESKTGQQRAGGDAYASYSDEMMRQVAIFLGFTDPLADKVELKAALQTDSKDTKGQAVVKANMIVIRDERDAHQMAGESAEAELANKVKSALVYIEGLSKKNLLNELLCKKDKNLLEIVRSLPEISPEAIRNDPSLPLTLGIWDQLPANLLSLWNSPRYFRGRRLLVSIPTDPMVGSPRFLRFVVGSTHIHPGYQGEIVDFDSKTKEFVISYRSSDGNTISLRRSEDDIHMLNGGQEFGTTENGKLCLEDGIRADYSNPLVKAKIYEIALQLKTIVSKLDFSSPAEQVADLQKEAVLAIRKCLNIISFGRGVDRDRVGRTDNLGQLAANGQGQCHGLSSTMSGYLYVFSKLLGIDILYRGGTSYVSGQGQLSASVEMHQWIQLTFRPSMKSYICDLWYQDTLSDDRYLCMPLEEAMMKVSCPHASLKLKNTTEPLQPTDILI